jgi:Phosphopantetheine attachment site.
MKFLIGIKDMSTINPKAGAEALGIDSLMSAEIKNTLQEQFSVNLTSQQIYNLMATTLREHNV